MGFSNPAVQDFKNQFVRDFPYGTDPTTTILDSDISSAFQFVNVNFNPDFWADQGSYTLGYLLLAAHYLVMNIRASSQGIVGQFNFTQQSKSVGAVAEAFGIPQRILDNPDWAMLCKTNYGAQYLQLILPQMTGQVFGVFEMTKP
jgi:hypothetical protein